VPVLAAPDAGATVKMAVPAPEPAARLSVIHEAPLAASQAQAFPALTLTVMVSPAAATENDFGSAA
jgi:hypothetical protein